MGCVDRIDNLSHPADDRLTNPGVDQTAGEDQGQIKFLVEELGNVLRILLGESEQLFQQSPRFTGVGEMLDVFHRNRPPECPADQGNIPGGKNWARQGREPDTAACSNCDHAAPTGSVGRHHPWSSAQNLGGDSSRNPDKADNSPFGQTLSHLDTHSTCVRFIQQPRHPFEQKIRGEARQRLKNVDQFTDRFQMQQGVSRGQSPGLEGTGLKALG